MNKNPALSILALTMLLVFSASLVFTTPALADGGTTPATPPASGNSGRGSHPSSNNLSGVPSGTKVVIVDGQGDKLSLASQVAQDILNNGDPVWCPATLAAPTPGAGGCTGGFTSMSGGSGLLDYLIANQSSFAANGTIWIENTYVSGTNSGDTGLLTFTLDGSTDFTTMQAYTLTIQGGWNGVSGNGTPSGVSEFNGVLQILNWNNNVTVNNVLVNGAIAGDGLKITTSKNITLNSVESDGNTGGMGANLNNTGGTGTVTVNSSEFDSNFDVGLNVVSHGAITVSNLTANNGLGRAVVLDNCVEAVHGTLPCTTSSAQPVTLSGTSQINGNNLYGIEIDSTGAITINSLTASNNGAGYGAYLDNHGATSAQGVTLTGTNVFDNDFAGIEVHSIGAIKVNNLTADNSGPTGNGAYLDNCNYTGSVCTTPTSQAVTLTGTNEFNGNKGVGLYVYSNGQITDSGTKLTADNNGVFGAYFKNVYPPTISGVTVSGIGEFNGNGDTGLNINSSGTVLVSTTSIDASGNAGSGLYINNGVSAVGTATLSGINQFSGNGLNGLQILSSGNISVSSVTASGNGTAYDGVSHGFSLSGGVYLYNDSSTANVTMTGNSTIVGNYESGLVITSHGVIVTNNINASGNGLKGNVVGGLQWSGVVVTGSTSAVPKTVSLNGTNTFNNNYFNGLYIRTPSAVTITSVTANGNANGAGAYIDNCLYGVPCAVSLAEAVTINGTNTFNNNGSDGLDVYSFGNIKAAGLNASNNLGNGAVLRNDLSTAAPVPSKGTVTLTGAATFNDNQVDGFDAFSFGVVKTAGVRALDNGAYGANLQNYGAGTAQAVSVTGLNTLSYNGNDGLYVLSKGAITVSSATADSNSGMGLNLSNFYTGMKSSVVVSGINNFNFNAANGLNVLSNGAITVGAFTANGDDGTVAVLLDNCHLGSNCGNPTAQNVTLTGSDVISNSQDNGLEIFSSGIIAVNTTALLIEKNGNSLDNGAGIILDNSGALTAKTVTVKGSVLLDRNAGVQMSIRSKGAIAAGSLTALDNGLGNGVSLVNDSYDVPGASGGVTLTGINVFNGNVGDGLIIQSSGAITVNNVTSNGNGQTGMLLDNCNDHGLGCTTSIAQPITLAGVFTASGNGTSGSYGGITVSSKGIIKANAVTAVGNTLGGASFDNHQGATTATFTLSGVSSFNGNAGGSGLSINSNGAVTISGGSYFNNNSAGDGLLITTSGAVKLTKITADTNSADGLNVTTASTLGLTCGTLLGNTGYGINLHTTGAVTLTSAVIFGNTAGNTPHQTGAGAVTNTITNCTLP